MNHKRMTFIEATACVGLLIVSASVLLACSYLSTEDSAGRPSPLALLFKPCAFRAYTGIPCPTCGWTRAFVHIAHFRVGSAFSTQPFGAMLAIVLHLAAISACAVLVLRKSPTEHLARIPWVTVGLGTLVLLLAGWAYVILTRHFW